MARATPDFFAAQAAARRRTALLLAWFGLALLALVALFYVGLALPLFATRDGRPLLHAELLGFVALGVLGTTTVGCVYHVVNLARRGAAGVMEGVGATRLDASTGELSERRLLDVVEEMAIASGIPVPQVFVLRDEPGINALAAGRATRSAAVAVTSGALEHLTRDELQAVVAHEFGHLLNGDSVLNERLMGMLGGLSILDLFGRQALELASSGGRRDTRLGLLLLPSGIVLAVAGWAGLLCGQVVRAGVSRQREYLADASAAQFTRNPGALASALAKIRDHGSALQRARAVEASHFFFANALEGLFARWMQTHPPIEERIRRLDPSRVLGVPLHADRSDSPARSPAQTAAHGAAQGPMRGAAQAPAQPATTHGPVPSRALLDTIGAPRAEHLAWASEILASLPAEVALAARSPESAPSLLVALAASDGPATRDRAASWGASPSPDAPPSMGAMGSSPATDATRGFPLAGLSRAQRLCAADLAVATLDVLPPARLEALSHALDRAMRQDAHVTVFEWMLGSLVRRRVERRVSSRRPRPPRFAALAQVEVECLQLLSLVAWSGSHDAARAREALSAGVRELGTGPGWTVLPRDRLGPAVADGALRTLAQATLDVRRRVLRACAAASAIDGRITSAEAELLRVVASFLECPIPPVLPGVLSPDSLDSAEWRIAMPK